MTTQLPWGANWRNPHVLFFSSRRTLERARTAVAQGTAQTQGRSSHCRESCGSGGYRFYPAHRRSLADVAQRIGLWQRRNLLAQTPRLDESWCLAQSAPTFTECAWASRADRSFPRGYRQPICPSSFWGDHTGPNPTDRAKHGCKRHIITDANGLPLVVHTTPANINDGVPALKLLDLIPPIKGKCGRPRLRPEIFQGDAAYGTPTNLTGTKERGITPLMARPGQRIAGQQHGSGLGRFRYVVERTLAWFGYNRRLKICYEKTGAHFQAFHQLAAALICARRLAALRF